MASASRGSRFYGEFAAWWPLISPVSEYAEEATFAARVLRSATIPVRAVLELGSGGGHNAFYLKKRFEMTLADLSAQMLDVSKRLNPECEHLLGDMRSLRLERRFDAVFIHDAIDCMTTEADLRSAIETAFVHCRPGGVAVFVPDHLPESWEPDTDCGGSDGPDGRGVRFLEWSWDPDPSDTWIVTHYAFVFRHADGSIETADEAHRTGLFPERLWLRAIEDAGFRADAILEDTSEDRVPRRFFVGHRP